MTTATPEKTDGLKALQTAIEEIDKSITSLGGVFKIQMPVNHFVSKFHQIILKINLNIVVIISINFLIFILRSCIWVFYVL